MEQKEKREGIEAFFQVGSPQGNGVCIPGKLALPTGAEEDLTWGVPFHTLEGKNVFGIIKSRNCFGVCFPQGSFFKRPRKGPMHSRERPKG